MMNLMMQVVSKQTDFDQVLEVERDRLAEYVRVLSKRQSAAEEKASEAEFYLRDERRKTAKLERMLEQARMETLKIFGFGCEDPLRLG